MENIELLANAIILQAVKDYRHTYSPQCRAEIKRFFVPNGSVLCHGLTEKCLYQD